MKSNSDGGSTKRVGRLRSDKMRSDTKSGRNPYHLTPIKAFREDEELDLARLPIRLVTQPLRVGAWVLICTEN